MSGSTAYKRSSHVLPYNIYCYIYTLYNLPAVTVAVIAECELVEVEGSVPVGEIRTVTTDHQTNHNDNYVNYSITQECNFLFSIILLISHKRYKNIFTLIIHVLYIMYM